jgi:hypothetical protein
VQEWFEAFAQQRRETLFAIRMKEMIVVSFSYHTRRQQRVSLKRNRFDGTGKGKGTGHSERETVTAPDDTHMLSVT